MNILQNIVEFDYITGGIKDEAHNLKPGNFVTQKVIFEIPFSTPPFIQISIERIDSGGFIEPSLFFTKSNNGEEKMLNHSVVRLDCSVIEKTNTGFTLKIKTWNANVIYAARISWIAFGNFASVQPSSQSQD